MDSEKLIKTLGGISAVARLCECTPQAVQQWYGKDRNGRDRTIPNARLLHLRAVRKDVFRALSKEVA